ncbi:hypothetical protein CUMW_197500 [Citrus unshiu]|uniref:Ubiquitin-like protease family profile domain-containing protein n=1 Tax=Citrus unshiu TaxID=55188 RepID=A0A2H5Q5F1_CITUN|nr:hypothetical protein CUMW_197500 [Citrus unshiu]
MIYESLDNALFEKDEKFKKTRLKNLDHNIEKYNLYGFTSGVQAWIYEAIGGLPSTWVVKMKKKIPRILQWKSMASLRINFAEGDVLQSLEPNSNESSRKYWLSVKDYLPTIPDWVHKHQPSINAMPSVTRQSDEHDDHDDIPNPIPEQHHDTSEDEVTGDDHQQQTDNSDDARESESRTKQFNDYMRRRLDKIDRNVYEIKSELKDFKETVVGFIDTFSKRPNKDSLTARSYAAPDDYGVYTDVGNQNLSTPTSLYSFYGNVSGESVQVFTEVPPGVSKFGRAYIPSYVYNSPYMIPPVRRGQNVRPLPRPQIMEHAIDMSTSVDVNPLRGLEDFSLFAEFDRWFTSDIRVRRRVQHPRSFFQIILGTDSIGWLDDEHIHEYLRLISEKQQQYPNALLQRVTHTDTFFWLLIPVNLDGAHWLLARVDFRKNKVWIYNSLLTFCDDKRYKLKLKPLEVIFPRRLEYVGFYNIRPELRSADPWKVMAVKSASQQELGTGDCGFNDVEYFRKKIAVDIFNDDIVL